MLYVCDVARVAAEVGDVVPHPAHSLPLVLDAVVARPAARRRQLRRAEEAEHPHPVVERDDDYGEKSGKITGATTRINRNRALSNSI
eukprot:gene3797-biopygen12540